MQDNRFNNDAFILNLFDNKIYIIQVKVNGLKSTWKLEFQSNVFDDIRNKFVSAYSILTSNNWLQQTKIYFQSCQLMFRSIKDGLALQLNKLESPWPNDALCQIWLKLALTVVLEKKSKLWKVYRQTTGNQKNSLELSAQVS